MARARRDDTDSTPPTPQHPTHGISPVTVDWWCRKYASFVPVTWTGTAGDAPPTIWARWADRVGRRPWPYLVVSMAILLALAAPLLSMRLGETDAGTLPQSSTQRRAMPR